MVDKMVTRLEHLVETDGDKREISYLATALLGVIEKMPEVIIETDLDLETLKAPE